MNNPTNQLKMSLGNAKLDKDTLIFSLPAGHSCPGAKDCKASVSEVDGVRVLTDGPNTKYRCFAASSEIQYENVYALRKHNYDIILPIIRDVDAMVKVIIDGMSQHPLKKVAKVRVHESGDHKTYSYFKAWMNVATEFPELTFYSYTKSLPFVVRGIKEGVIPSNFIFTASKGGEFDYLIEENGFKSVTVTTSKEETEAALASGGLFDKNDNLAVGSEDFYLKLHGQQPKGSPMAKYWASLVRSKEGGYSKRKKTAKAPKKVKVAKKVVKKITTKNNEDQVPLKRAA